MKSTRLFALAAAGLAVVVLGFFYDVLYAGIPYQDPTPEMLDRYRFHANIATIIQWVGGIVILAAMLAFSTRAAVRALRRIDPTTRRSGAGG